MKLCRFGLHRWEKEEGGALTSPEWRCLDCGAVIKEGSVATVYHVPKEADSRIIDFNKKVMMFAAAGLLAVSYLFLKKGRD